MNRKQRIGYEVRKAIAAGEIVRPDRCSLCQKPCVPHAHHDDYDRPMDVRFLCRQCHKIFHIDRDGAVWWLSKKGTEINVKLSSKEYRTLLARAKRQERSVANLATQIIRRSIAAYLRSRRPR